MFSDCQTTQQRRRRRYHEDPSFRLRVLRSVARYEGRDTSYLPEEKKTCYTSRELCDLCEVSIETLDRYQQIGIIPLPTYPSANRVYWPHQALLVMRLFKRLRDEGWPAVMPHYDGSRSWAKFFARIKEEWPKKGSTNGYRKTRGGSHD